MNGHVVIQSEDYIDLEVDGEYFKGITRHDCDEVECNKCYFYSIEAPHVCAHVDCRFYELKDTPYPHGIYFRPMKEFIKVQYKDTRSEEEIDITNQLLG
jgi:hypothetical protein